MKTKLLFTAAAALGAAAIVWMAARFVGTSPLALAITALIGFAYLLGVVELIQYRRATASLAMALGALESGWDGDLPRWLDRLQPGLRNACAQRVEGERSGLPAPVFAPYLVGLLILLGLLGTFVGMVASLQGAVVALEGSTELAAIRQGLAAPIQGLGIAFGTSVAGVAASAMLGLCATLSRRERVLATRELDRHIASTFRDLSLDFNRRETYRVLRAQADALPRVADQMAGLAGQLEQLSAALSSQLLDNQQRFHDHASERFETLAASVDNSLRKSLADAGRLAGESVAPLLRDAVDGLAAHSREQSSQLVGEIGRLLASSEALVEQRAANEAEWLAGHQQRMAELAGTINTELAALRDAESRRGTELAAQLGTLQRDTADGLATGLAALQAQAQQGLQQLQADAGEQLSALHSTLAEQLGALDSGSAERITGLEQRSAERITALEASSSERLAALQAAASEGLAALEQQASEQLAGLGRELEAPMLQLIETAGEAPRAAAEVIGRLREEITHNIERGNQMLEERHQILEDLSGLSTSLHAASAEQRAAIAELVSQSAGALQAVSEEFSTHLSGEAQRLSELTTDVAGSAMEMASLGDAFGLAVQLFSDANGALIDNLTRIEESMQKSTERSDEQMGYYVAQAREIIDQSMLSQREIIDELRRLGQTPDLFAAEAAG